MWGWITVGAGAAAYLSLCYVLERMDAVKRDKKKAALKSKNEKRAKTLRQLKLVLRDLRRQQEQELEALRKYKLKQEQKKDKPDWGREGF